MASESLLFDVSPVEDEDSKKKKKSTRRKQAADQVLPQIPEPEPEAAGFLLSLDSVPCWQCGAPADLDSVVRIREEVVDECGKVSLQMVSRWRVTCGWWCMHSWYIPPIPGLLDKKDDESPQFVLREGMFAGKTLDEVSKIPGGDLYIKNLPSMTDRKSVAQAAIDWLAKKNR